MSLLTAFDQQCKLIPNSIALIENNHQLSYLQVQQQSLLISRKLIDNEISNFRVIIAIDRGIYAAIAILSVLRIEACYIPLDLKNPEHRLRYIIQDANPQYILGRGNCPAWIDQPELWIDIDLILDTYSADQPDKNTNYPKITDTSLAAILYTSGSTGKPKGVALSHLAMQNFADWAAKTFNISNNDKIASLAPFYFDLSVFDLFTSLSCGATINFIPNKLTFSPSRLTAWLNANQINVIYTVPSILSFIALKGALETTPLKHLRIILFAGEVFPTPLLIKLCQKLANVQLFNLYGPTETNVCCYWPVDREQLDSDKSIPIGYPACDAELAIDITTGELLVKSKNNLSGYWQNGQLTSALSSDNYYATGDLVSINDKDEYCYHGRLDRMMKCSGYRVEPAEIEQAILQCPEVESCSVIAIKDSTSGQRPAAALVLKANGKLADIIKPIKLKLPVYMHPCKYLILKSIPYLSNGKTNYKKLQQQLEDM